MNTADDNNEEVWFDGLSFFGSISFPMSFLRVIPLSLLPEADLRTEYVVKLVVLAEDCGDCFVGDETVLLVEVEP